MSEHKFKTTDIKGKPYVAVNERIKYFWQTYPAPKGRINTILIEDEDEVCTFRAIILIDDVLVATGHAQEDKKEGYINKTSYVENCETSAVGRALGMLGIGIDTSIATAEEVDLAIAGQNEKIELVNDKELHVLRDGLISIDKDEGKFCGFLKVDKLENLPKIKYRQAIEAIEASRLKKESKDGDN